MFRINIFKVDKRDTKRTSIKDLNVVFIPLTLNMHLHAVHNIPANACSKSTVFQLMGTWFHFGVFIINFEHSTLIYVFIYNFEHVLQISYFCLLFHRITNVIAFIKHVRAKRILSKYYVYSFKLWGKRQNWSKIRWLVHWFWIKKHKLYPSYIVHSSTQF